MSCRLVFILFQVTGLLVGAAITHGHGWSEEMLRKLNAPAPDWLTISIPIRVTTTQGPASAPPAIFRDKAGGASTTGTRIVIPTRGIEIRVDYPINWWANGASLSPDGSKLIVNSGGDSHLFEILPDGSYREVEILLPTVTYDDGPKGFISNWAWAGDGLLIGEAEIDNMKGEFIDKRIYVFHVKERALSRLDVSALNLPTTEGLTVTKVATDLSSLTLSLGDADFVVKADLKSAPQSIKQGAPTTKTASSPAVQPKAPKIPETTPAPTTLSDEAASSTPWSIVVVLFVAACGLLWLLLKRRS